MKDKIIVRGQITKEDLASYQALQFENQQLQARIDELDSKLADLKAKQLEPLDEASLLSCDYYRSVSNALVVPIEKMSDFCQTFCKPREEVK